MEEMRKSENGAGGGRDGELILCECVCVCRPETCIETGRATKNGCSHQEMHENLDQICL